MDAEKLILGITHTPRKLVNVAGVLGAVYGLDYARTNYAEVQQWFEDMPGWEEVGANILVGWLGMLAANKAYSFLVGPINKSVGGPLL
jgi:hypothetical protein